MNSGADSFLNLKSLLLGNPAAHGFSDKQLQFMKNVLKCRSETIDIDIHSFNFLISHAPVLNPMIRQFYLKNLINLAKSKSELRSHQYYETVLKRKGRGDGRANKILKFDHGTISRNRKNTLAFAYSKKLILLAGHTHLNREFRVELDEKVMDWDTESDDKGNSWDELKEDPFAIYWDRFIERYGANYIEKHLPFLIQTPSIGIGAYPPGKEEYTIPIREFVIENNHIQKGSLHYLGYNKRSNFLKGKKLK